MTRTRTKRLPRAERRDQLLATALEIVQEQGTDALTLGYLAERAGVSKPIAYEHFGSRSGLLIALSGQIHEQHVTSLREALEVTPKRLEQVAEVVGEAYMECSVEMGPESYAITAAMKGDEQMDAFQQEQMERYIALYCEALAPYTELPSEELRLRCIGIIGAAEALAQEVLQHRVDRARAASSVASLIVCWLSANT